MRVVCTNGFYEFYPKAINDLQKFNIAAKENLVFYNGFFIPKPVYDLDDVNFKLEPVGGFPCISSTFNKYDLFKINDLTYNLDTHLVTSTLAIAKTQEIAYDGFSYASKNILQAGTIYKGNRIRNFIGVYDFNVFNIESLS